MIEAVQLGGFRLGDVGLGDAPAAGHVEAVRTSISPGGIWAMVVVVVACLAFWLIAVNVASIDVPARRRRRIAMALTREEALSGTLGGAPAGAAGRATTGVTGATPAGAAGAATIGAAAAGAARLAQTVPSAREQVGSEPGAVTPEPASAQPPSGTRVPPSGAVRILGPEDEQVPSQRSASTEPIQTGQDPRHAMPAQRTADTDQPERSATSDNDRR
jgi:hypothetical protein